MKLDKSKFDKAQFRELRWEHLKELVWLYGFFSLVGIYFFGRVSIVYILFIILDLYVSVKYKGSWVIYLLEMFLLFLFFTAFFLLVPLENNVPFWMSSRKVLVDGWGDICLLSVGLFILLYKSKNFITSKVKLWDSGEEVLVGQFMRTQFEHYIIDGNVKVWNYLDINNQEVEYYLVVDAKEEHDFKGKEQTGVSRLYYENGQLRREIEFKRGKADGQCVEFYETGEPLTKESYKDGKLYGMSRSYYKNGGIECERYYENGMIIGQSKTYYENGLLKSVMSYRNGSLQGVSRTYYPNGMPEMEKNYENGKVVSKHRFYQQKFEFVKDNVDGNKSKRK